MQDAVLQGARAGAGPSPVVRLRRELLAATAAALDPQLLRATPQTKQSVEELPQFYVAFKEASRNGIICPNKARKISISTACSYKHIKTKSQLILLYKYYHFFLSYGLYSQTQTSSFTFHIYFKLNMNLFTYFCTWLLKEKSGTSAVKAPAAAKSSDLPVTSFKVS